jgi:hypothetical protein
MNTNDYTSSRTSVTGTQTNAMSQVPSGTSEVQAATASATAPTEIMGPPPPSPNRETVLPQYVHRGSSHSYLSHCLIYNTYIYICVALSSSQLVSKQSHDVMHIGSWAPTESQLDIMWPEDIPQSIIIASTKSDSSSGVQEGQLHIHQANAMAGERNVQGGIPVVGLL